MTALLFRMVALTIAFLAVDALMDTVTVTGGFFSTLGVAVVYGLISGVLGTLLRLLTLPLIVLTVGLFEFVINAVMLLITDAVSDTLEIAGFGSTLLAAVILSVVSALIGFVISVVLPQVDA